MDGACSTIRAVLKPRHQSPKKPRRNQPNLLQPLETKKMGPTSRNLLIWRTLILSTSLEKEKVAIKIPIMMTRGGSTTTISKKLLQFGLVRRIEKTKMVIQQTIQTMIRLLFISRRKLGRSSLQPLLNIGKLKKSILKKSFSLSSVNSMNSSTKMPSQVQENLELNSWEINSMQDSLKLPSINMLKEWFQKDSQ